MRIIVPGAPIAKKRPRFARRGKFVQTYNEQETEEGRWLWEAQQQIDAAMQGAVKVEMLFAMPRPKSHYGTGRNEWKLKESAPLLHTKKPDIDNLQKWVLDCLNGILWVDDSCVVEARARKEYAEKPMTVITVTEV